MWINLAMSSVFGKYEVSVSGAHQQQFYEKCRDNSLRNDEITFGISEIFASNLKQKYLFIDSVNERYLEVIINSSIISMFW